MRLIDADKLESVDFSECIDLMEIMNVIDAQPTAYDVDAVEEQLKDVTAIGADCVGNAFECIPKYMAIEIVKGGGVE